MQLFWRLIVGEPDLGQQISGHYNQILVAMSIAVACLAGFAALSVVDRIKASEEASAKRFWLLAGSGSMGAGIWAMHFTAMMAFSMHGPVRYDLWITLASVLPAMIGSGFALHFMARPTIGWKRLQVGALLLASGIGTMHYLGMEAMRMKAVLRYDLTLFILSIVIAHVLATLALYMEFVPRARVWLYREWIKGAAAIIMGFAVSGMHYTAMAAAQFYPGSAASLSDGLVFSPLSMAGSIVGITSLIMVCAIVAARINRRLQETEARERSVLDAMVDGVILTDAEGIIETVNPAVSLMFGYDRDKLPGEHVDILLPSTRADSSSPTALSGTNGATRRNQCAQIECFGNRRDGTWFPVELSISQFEMAGRLKVSRLVRDITERKLAEAALGEAHKQTERLLSSISSILIGVDRDDRITRWNEAAERTFGITAADIVSTSFLECGIKWDWNEMHMRISECRDRDQPTQLHDIQFTRSDEKERFLDITINPIVNETRELSGYLLLATDITERKHLESQLVQAQKLESIGQLAAGIAHEINTPIHYVGDNTRFLNVAFEKLVTVVDKNNRLLQAAKENTVTEELIAEVDSLIEETKVKYIVSEIPMAIEETLGGVEQVATIVRAMKEFSHPGTKEKALTDINKALENTIAVASSEWKYVAELQKELEPSLPLVPCLPGELNQVFLNIIVNAAHAIGDVVSGGGAKGIIEVSTVSARDYVEIRIKDTGKGIPEEIRAKIFDPFFTTKEVGKGTGQGLAIAHNVVVEKHGGSIFFDSEPGTGTTFCIKLPLNVPGGGTEANIQKNNGENSPG